MGDRQLEAPESGFDLTRTEDHEHDVHREMGNHEAVRPDTTKSPFLTTRQDKVHRKMDCEDQGRQREILG